MAAHFLRLNLSNRDANTHNRPLFAGNIIAREMCPLKRDAILDEKMLYEIDGIKTYENEFKRRWFFDHDIDLTVWLDEFEEIVGFQLCYDKPKTPRAFTWWEKTGYHHHEIDDGERVGTLARKGIPILMRDGLFDKERIAKLFQEKSKDIDPGISAFVGDKIMQFF